MDSKQPTCKAPFSQLLLDPKGNVYPCCHHFGYKLGNVHHTPLDQIASGNKLRRLQDEHLSGQHRICKSRMTNENCHLRYNHLPDTQGQHHTYRLDLRLGGQCNLKCVMCEVWAQPNGTYDTPEFWQYLRDLAPSLLEVEMLGGEPFIQTITSKAIKVVHHLNPNVKWSFVTNGHYHVRKILSTVENLNLKQVHVSLDSLDHHTYKAIRGGNLDLPLKTLEALIELRKAKHFQLKISLAVMQQNWQEIPDFLAFAHRKDLTPEFQYVHFDPSKKSSLNLAPLKEREKVLQYLNEAIKLDQQTYIQSIKNSLQYSIERCS